MKPWYEQWPDRLDFELQELRAANIPYEVDEEAKKGGRIVLKLTVNVEGEAIPLEVYYPDLYPYFRFQVVAPGLELDHHQNPISKNLCLLGRRTHEWHVDRYTIARLIAEQLPTVLRVARSDPADIEPGTEAPQGEPCSTYYTYQRGAIVIVQSDWQIPIEHDYGTLTIATVPSGEPVSSFVIRGVVTEIFGEDGELLVQADAMLQSPYTGPSLGAAWVRIPSLPASDDPGVFFNSLTKHDPVALKRAPNNTVCYDGRKEAHLNIIGALVQEELGYNEPGDGWVFACLFRPKMIANRPATGGGRQRMRKPHKRR